MKDKERGKLFYSVSLAIQMGLIVALPLTLILFLGVYLDKRFNTLPLLTFFFTILALIFIYFELKNLLIPFYKKEKEHDHGVPPT
jgi:F0F1-type ATP synthase assembly protein I